MELETICGHEGHVWRELFVCVSHFDFVSTSFCASSGSRRRRIGNNYLWQNRAMFAAFASIWSKCQDLPNALATRPFCLSLVRVYETRELVYPDMLTVCIAARGQGRILLRRACSQSSPRAVAACSGPRHFSASTAVQKTDMSRNPANYVKGRLCYRRCIVTGGKPDGTEGPLY